MSIGPGYQVQMGTVTNEGNTTTRPTVVLDGAETALPAWHNGKLFGGDRVLCVVIGSGKKGEVYIVSRRIDTDHWLRIGDPGAPAFQNGWVNYAGGYPLAGYVVGADGTVKLRGLVKSGATGTIFTLPAGILPSYKHVFIALAGPNGFARVDVGTDGTVALVTLNDGATNSWLSLDGISFSIGH